MGLLWVAAAAANKAQTSHTGSTVGGTGDDYFEQDSSYSTKKFSFYDYVFKEVKEDESKELYNFFTLLNKEYIEDFKQMYKPLDDKISQSVEEIKTLAPHMVDFNKKMLAKGCNLHMDLYLPDYGRDAVGSFGGELYLSNLLNMTREEIKKAFQENYFKYKEIIRKKQERKDNIYTEITRLERKVKFSIFNKDKKKKDLEKIHELKRMILVVEYHIQNYLDELKKIEILSNLTDSELDLLMEGLEEVKKVNIKRKEINKLVQKREEELEEYIVYDAMTRKVNKDVMMTTLKRLYKEGKITKEQITKIIVHLDRIYFKMENGEYKFKSTYNKSQGEELMIIIKWFIDEIYEKKYKFNPNKKTLQKTKKQ